MASQAAPEPSGRRERRGRRSGKGKDKQKDGGGEGNSKESSQDRARDRSKDRDRDRDRDRRSRDRRYESEEEREARRERRRQRREERERREREGRETRQKKAEEAATAKAQRKAEVKEAGKTKKKAVRFGLSKKAKDDGVQGAESKHRQKGDDRQRQKQKEDDILSMGALGGGEKQKSVEEVEKEYKEEMEEERRHRRHRRQRRQRREETAEERRERHARRREKREKRMKEREAQEAERQKKKGPAKASKKGVALGSSENQEFLDALGKREEYVTVKKTKKLSKQEKKTELSRQAHRSSYDLPLKTTLYQGRIRSPEEAPEIFQSVTFTKVPLVLIPDDRPTCSFWFVNPTGHYGITQRKGVSTQALTKEGKNYACSWTRVAYCVSQQTTTYSCPVRRCPTFDNVNIDVNIKLIFRIGADPTDVKNFAYLLGASRFDEFLHVTVQEAIRTLVRSSYWSEARDLFHNHPSVKAILKGLNKIFNFFGVFFEQSIITDVVFSNPELRQTLQATTAFQSKVKEHVQSHEFRVKTSKMMLTRHLTKLAAQHRLNLRQIQHERKVLQAQRNAIKVQLEQEREVAILTAQRKSEVELLRAQKEVDVCVQDAEAESQSVLLGGEDRSKVEQVLAEGKCAIMASEAEKNADKLFAKAKLINAAAEAKAKHHMRSSRRHELRGKKADMLKVMAGHRQIVISGEKGDDVLKHLLKQGYRRTILKAST